MNSENKSRGARAAYLIAEVVRIGAGEIRDVDYSVTHVEGTNKIRLEIIDKDKTPYAVTMQVKPVRKMKRIGVDYIPFKKGK